MMPVWYLIASLCIFLANGQLYENIKPESSSTTPDQRLSGTKEYLLYLTPDQVQTLQSKGAVVRPLLQLENAYLQQQYQQNVGENIEPQDQTGFSNEERKLDKDLDDIYKALEYKQATEALVVQSQSTENPHPKFKFTSKPRKQEYASLYVPKKINKTKNYSTEYTRYLPTYETEVLKAKTYRAQPLPGYNFEDTEGNLELPSYLGIETAKDSRATEIPKVEEVPKRDNFQRPEQLQEPAEEKPTQIQRFVNIEIPDEIQGDEEIKKFIEDQQRVMNSRTLNIRNQLQTPDVVRRPEDIQSIRQIPTYTIATNQQRIPTTVQSSTEKTEPVIFNERKIYTANDQEVKKNQGASQIQTPPLIVNKGKISLFSLTQPAPLSSPAVDQTQYSALLAPLLQHEKISENKAQQKQLVNSERAIHLKLQQIKESGSHDVETYITELDKLRQNLGKQNILAEKIALQNYPKKPQGLTKEDITLKNRGPVGTVPAPEVSQLVTPRPYPAVWVTPSSIPVPFLQPGKDIPPQPAPIEEEEEKTILIPRNRNTYSKENIPYSWQKIVAANNKQQTPLANPLDQRFIILRPIWEH